MKSTNEIIDQLRNHQYFVSCIDGRLGMQLLPDKSVKLVYGSPPYPNAVRDYGVWSSDEYLSRISPFINVSMKKLRDDGFLVINLKANRERAKSNRNTTRSLVVEKFAILLEEKWALNCVDIEIWVKDNPISTGLRVACQDSYEQILWFAKSPIWKINLDAIRRPYSDATLKLYDRTEYKPRSNGLTYVRKKKKIIANPLGALPTNVIRGAVSSKRGVHQAVQPSYIPEKYILATTQVGDIVLDPWMGTGTTGFESLRLHRRFVGFDLVNSYVKEFENSLKSSIDRVVDCENS